MQKLSYLVMDVNPAGGVVAKGPEIVLFKLLIQESRLLERPDRVPQAAAEYGIKRR